jgi:hypothetical protein
MVMFNFDLTRRRNVGLTEGWGGWSDELGGCVLVVVLR